MSMRNAERWIVCTLVLLAHAMLLWAWPRPHPQRAPAPREPVSVAVTLLLPPPPPIAVPTPSVPAARAAARAPERVPRPRRSSQAEPSQAVTVAPPADQTATPPEPAASSSAPLDLRLAFPRGSAGRGGLTEPHNSMRRQALNDPRSNIKTDPTQVLPNAVAASAKGDCLKGEYFGGGAGLLSAPFLAYAAMAGNCKPAR